MLRRSVIALVVFGVAALAIGIAAYSTLESHPTVVPSGGADCGPPPCAAPEGFEADLSDIAVSGGLVRLSVRLRNRTTPGFEAVTYRHTSPADFQLELTDGTRVRPAFADQGCPQWNELRVERGGASDPQPLCFATPLASLAGVALVWDPDLGVVPHPIAIPLRR